MTHSLTRTASSAGAIKVPKWSAYSYVLAFALCMAIVTATFLRSSVRAGAAPRTGGVVLAVNARAEHRADRRHLTRVGVRDVMKASCGASLRARHWTQTIGRYEGH